MSMNQIGSFCRSTSYSGPMISSPLLLCTDAVFSFSPGLPPSTRGCQRPEARLTALHQALRATGLSDCCNMLQISLGSHTEYNHQWVPHQSFAMPHPRNLLLRLNEQCAICHVPWLHTKSGNKVRGIHLQFSCVQSKGRTRFSGLPFKVAHAANKILLCWFCHVYCYGSIFHKGSSKAT